MGPYCNYCDKRCFARIPDDLPEEMLRKYGIATITATCSGGQAFEKEKLGICYADIQSWQNQQLEAQRQEAFKERVNRESKERYEKFMAEMTLPKAIEFLRASAKSLGDGRYWGAEARMNWTADWFEQQEKKAAAKERLREEANENTKLQIKSTLDYWVQEDYIVPSQASVLKEVIDRIK